MCTRVKYKTKGTFKRAVNGKSTSGELPMKGFSVTQSPPCFASQGSDSRGPVETDRLPSWDGNFWMVLSKTSCLPEFLGTALQCCNSQYPWAPSFHLIKAFVLQVIYCICRHLRWIYRLGATDTLRLQSFNHPANENDFYQNLSLRPSLPLSLCLSLSLSLSLSVHLSPTHTRGRGCNRDITYKCPMEQEVY